eukprot:766618-Hanusia_phi.AAC.7
MLPATSAIVAGKIQDAHLVRQLEHNGRRVRLNASASVHRIAPTCREVRGGTTCVPYLRLNSKAIGTFLELATGHSRNLASEVGSLLNAARSARGRLVLGLEEETKDSVSRCPGRVDRPAET